MLAVAVLTVASLFPGTAVAAGPFLEEEYESSPTSWSSDWWDADIGGRNRVSSISDGESGKAIKVSIPKGSHLGSAMHWRFGDNGFSEPDELWFRYYLRIPDGYVNHGRGKLPGPAGLYSSSARNNIKPSNSNPGWSARMYFSPTYTADDGDYSTIGYYTYHRGQSSNEGDFDGWEGTAARLQHGEWYCVEGYVGMNTPGKADGKLIGYVDEKLAFHQDDFTFLGSGDSGRGVRSFWFDVYYGGTDRAPGSISFDFDSLMLDEVRVGCGSQEPGSFRDARSSVHFDDARRMYAAGITRGCNPPDNTRYCPNDAVTRGQMAAFLVRALGLPAVSGTGTFSDDNGSVFEGDIEALAAAGITKGCATGRFCPGEPVTRGQMAAFLVRALGYTQGAGDSFRDDNGSVFEGDIEKLAAAGVTKGCNPPTNDRFCPGDPVTRGQMATFLSRALALPAAPPVNDAIDVPVVPSGYDAVVRPGDSLQAVVNSAPTGATILVESGVHELASVVPKSGQSLVGQKGAILDGRGITGVAITGSASNVTVRGLTIRDYATHDSKGAIDIRGTGWTVRETTVTGAASYGVSVFANGASIVGSRFENNGRAGVYAESVSGLILDGNTITGNNSALRDPTQAAGGVKLTSVSGAVLRNNTISSNLGNGVRSLQSTGTSVYENNTIATNRRNGIYHDQGGTAQFTGNVLRGNGTDPETSFPYFDGGIALWVTRVAPISVSGNTFDRNRNGLVVLERGVPSVSASQHGTFVITGNTFVETGVSGAAVQTTAYHDVLAFSSNAYRFNDTSARWWKRGSPNYSFPDWQGFGQDLDSTLTTP